MIVAQDLIKKFATRTAVDGVGFHVPAGSICGFLGPNGAGKSTSMGMLAGALEPDGGRVIMNGFDMTRQPVQARERVGWLPERAPAHLDASAQEFVRWSARMKGLDHASARQSAEGALEQCGLREVRHRLCSELSRGFRQRVGLAAALASRPKILLLDEPTAGLDPAQVLALRELLLSLKGAVTVLLSTHVLAEVQAICDRVIVLDRGRVIASGSLDQVPLQMGVAATIEMEVNDHARAAAAIAESGLQLQSSRLLDAPWHSLSAKGDVTTAVRNTLSTCLARDGVAVRRMDVQAGALEEAFRLLAREAP